MLNSQKSLLHMSQDTVFKLYLRMLIGKSSFYVKGEQHAIDFGRKLETQYKRLKGSG